MENTGTTTYNLTDADLELCNEFQALLKRVVTGNDAMVHAGVGWIDRSGAPFPTADVQDEYRAYSSDYELRSIGLQLQNAIDQFRAENPSEEERKAKRIAELKADLARLEQAA